MGGAESARQRTPPDGGAGDGGRGGAHAVGRKPTRPRADDNLRRGAAHCRGDRRGRGIGAPGDRRQRDVRRGLRRGAGAGRPVLRFAAAEPHRLADHRRRPARIAAGSTSARERCRGRRPPRRLRRNQSPDRAGRRGLRVRPAEGRRRRRGRTPRRGLRNLAECWRQRLGAMWNRTPAPARRAGSGGGLLAMLDATLEPGIDLVLEAVRFHERVARCDLCLTGEGKLDGQSLSGKAVLGVAKAAAATASRPTPWSAGSAKTPANPRRRTHRVPRNRPRPARSAGDASAAAAPAGRDRRPRSRKLFALTRHSPPSLHPRITGTLDHSITRSLDPPPALEHLPACRASLCCPAGLSDAPEENFQAT